MIPNPAPLIQHTIMASLISNTSLEKVITSSPQIPSPTVSEKRNLFCQLLQTIQLLSNHQQYLALPFPFTTLKGSFRCNPTPCKKCPIHIPTKSFTRPNDNLTYPIITLADCNSSNLVYQLEYKMLFTLKKNRSDAHKTYEWTPVTYMVVISDLPLSMHTKSHQPPFQECLSIHIIHKLPDATPEHVFCQFEIAYQLILQSRQFPGINIW